MSAKPDQTTSVYQARYHRELRLRGRWTPIDAGAARPADVVVRPVPDDVEPPAGGVPIFRDRRFTAYRITPAP